MQEKSIDPTKNQTWNPSMLPHIHTTEPTVLATVAGR